MALSKHKKHLIGLAAALTVGSVTAASAAALNVGTTKLSAGNQTLSEVCADVAVDYTVATNASNQFEVANVNVEGSNCSATDGTYAISVSIKDATAAKNQVDGTVTIASGTFASTSLDFSGKHILGDNIDGGNIAVYLNT